MRGIRRIPLALTLIPLVLLGGCMSSNDGDKNAPLPRMSRPAAQSWAAHFTESMARSAGVEIDQASVKPEFNDCVGKNDEIMHDGRFTLDYRTEAHVEQQRQADAVARIRDDLKKRGYTISSFRNDVTVDPPVTLEAYSPDKDFYILVEGYKSPQVLNFLVASPCLLPPGVKQEKV
jgi:hypothetical protein